MSEENQLLLSSYKEEDEYLQDFHDDKSESSGEICLICTLKLDENNEYAQIDDANEPLYKYHPECLGYWFKKSNKGIISRNPIKMYNLYLDNDITKRVEVLEPIKRRSHSLMELLFPFFYPMYELDSDSESESESPFLSEQDEDSGFGLDFETDVYLSGYVEPKSCLYYTLCLCIQF
jgi:hypothetical protein